MQAAAITGPSQGGCVERPDPRIAREFVKVKVLSAPLCTEFNFYKSGKVTDSLGHEAAGEVVEVAQPGRVKVGDRVVVMPQFPCGRCELCTAGDYIHCQQGVDAKAICQSESGTATYAQYCIKQDWLLLPIPDDISIDHGAMACCGLGPTFGAMQHLKVDAFDTVLVVGLGPVGLGAVINGVFRNARVIGVEGNPYRARLAKELGAETVVNPNDPDALKQIQSLTGGRGADKTINCTPVPGAQRLAIDATRRRGHVGIVSWGGKLELENLMPSGRILQGCWHWNLHDTFRMMQLIRRSARLLDQLITHTFPMTRVSEAWDLQLSGECGKVVLRPWAS